MERLEAERKAIRGQREANEGEHARMQAMLEEIEARKVSSPGFEPATGIYVGGRDSSRGRN